ncbi:hypothetical protein KSAC_05700 [Komagataeibacter saccharivorans]|nr:hypothetical protein KSAC_05700 [Komagataeibacter saccharivorans]
MPPFRRTDYPYGFHIENGAGGRRYPNVLLWLADKCANDPAGKPPAGITQNRPDYMATADEKGSQPQFRCILSTAGVAGCNGRFTRRKDSREIWPDSCAPLVRA